MSFNSLTIGIAPKGPRVNIPSTFLFELRNALTISLVSDGSEASIGTVLTETLFSDSIFLKPCSLWSRLIFPISWFMQRTLFTPCFNISSAALSPASYSLCPTYVRISTSSMISLPALITIIGMFFFDAETILFLSAGMSGTERISPSGLVAMTASIIWDMVIMSKFCGD